MIIHTDLQLQIASDQLLILAQLEAFLNSMFHLWILVFVVIIIIKIIEDSSSQGESHDTMRIHVLKGLFFVLSDIIT